MIIVKYYDNLPSVQCDFTSCVVCISNQPKYLVDYDRFEKTVKGVYCHFFPIKPYIFIEVMYSGRTALAFKIYHLNKGQVTIV